MYTLRVKVKTPKCAKCGPLIGFILLTFIGFVALSVCLILIGIFYDEIEKTMQERYDVKLKSMTIFLALLVFNTIGFLLSFIMMLVLKPVSNKIIWPAIFFVTVCFSLMIAIDFYIEVHMAYRKDIVPFAQTYTMSKDISEDEKKGKPRFKTGYLCIYSEFSKSSFKDFLIKFSLLQVSLCVVYSFIYLAFRDFQEYLNNRNQLIENENLPQQCSISHIT